MAAASSGKSQSSGALHKLPGLTGLADKINLLNGHSYANSKVDPSREASKVSISKEGMIEMPGKGWRYVYVARYSYDPFQHSPNDSPEAELQVWPQKRFFSMFTRVLDISKYYHQVVSSALQRTPHHHLIIVLMIIPDNHSAKSYLLRLAKGQPYLLHYF